MALLFAWQGARSADHSAPLGYPIEISDLYIPGELVEAIPRQDLSGSLVIRILQSKPAEDGYRYDLSVYGLDAGKHDLLEYLHYAATALPVEAESVPIEITVRHPLDQLPAPTELEARAFGRLGGYTALMTVLVVLWVIGLLVLIFYRKRQPASGDDGERQPTLHEKLLVLVTAASQGQLDEAEQARLERLLIGHWRQELPEIDELPAAQAIARLRSHEAASPLILKLEQWLHAPVSDVSQSQIEPLLEPFRRGEGSS